MTPRRDPEFGRRFFKAWNDLQSEEGGKISGAEIGQRVAAVMRRGKPYKQPAVSKWKAGTRPEDPVIRALAVVLRCDEQWLLTGDADGTATRRAAGGRR